MHSLSVYKKKRYDHTWMTAQELHPNASTGKPTWLVRKVTFGSIFQCKIICDANFDRGTGLEWNWLTEKLNQTPYSADTAGRVEISKKQKNFIWLSTCLFLLWSRYGACICWLGFRASRSMNCSWAFIAESVIMSDCIGSREPWGSHISRESALFDDRSSLTSLGCVHTAECRSVLQASVYSYTL